MKFQILIKIWLLVLCIGLNVIFYSSGYDFQKTKTYNAAKNSSFDYRINYAPAKKLKWPKTKKFLCPKLCTCSHIKARCRKLKVVPILRLERLKFLSIQRTQIKIIKREHFRRMFYLTELQLSSNKLSHIDDQSFEDLTRLEVLNLSSNKLHRVDRSLFKRLVSLRELDLSNNRLSQIEGGIGFLANLITLLLSRNRIASITNKTFYGNSKVTTLDLSFNRITDISWGAFYRMRTLSTLLLNNNPITHLDIDFDSNHFLEQLDATNCKLEQLFKDSPRQLKDLRLSGNELTSIGDEDFIKTNSVQLLLLNDNKIESLSDSAFDNMPLLHDLYLNKNRLTKLPVFMPSKLYSLYASHNNISSITWKPLSKKYNLNYLVLSHNRISHIDPYAMRSLIYLTHLDLSYNSLKYLKAGMFVRTGSLERLDLSHNPLQMLEPGCFMGLKKLHILKISSVSDSTQLDTAAFEDLTNLLYLDLSNSSLLTKQLLMEPCCARYLKNLRNLNIINTGLTQLPYKLKSNLAKLTTVRMTGNQWHCNKKLLWVRDWIRTSTVDFYEPENIVCRSPSRLKGKRIVDLTSYDTESEKTDDLFNKKLQILKRKLRKAFGS